MQHAAHSRYASCITYVLVVINAARIHCIRKKWQNLRAIHPEQSLRLSAARGMKQTSKCGKSGRIRHLARCELWYEWDDAHTPQRTHSNSSKLSSLFLMQATRRRRQCHGFYNFPSYFYPCARTTKIIKAAIWVKFYQSAKKQHRARESLPAAVQRRRWLQKVPMIVVWPIDWRETRMPLFFCRVCFAHAIKSHFPPRAFHLATLWSRRRFFAPALSAQFHLKVCKKRLRAIKIKRGFARRAAFKHLLRVCVYGCCD